MSGAVSALDLRLLDGWQRNFPLVARPFAAIGDDLDLGEAEVLDRLADLLRRRLISRVGAVVRPNTAGASTLAAMAVPPERLARVARRVSAEPAVNHNYEREHALNLWFVAAAPDRETVTAALSRIERDTGLAVLDLPLERAYHIDLGFGLRTGARRVDVSGAATITPDRSDLDLLAAIEDGLPLLPKPYRAVAAGLGCRESAVIHRLGCLIDGGVISRFGLIVRHRNLGYRANAMAVWDVPDDQVDRVAAAFARHDFVTLCYRRPRRRPRWPYNLFCMVHGRERGPVLSRIAELNAAAATAALPQAVLFSRRCFKQRGARFSDPRREAAA